MLQQHDVEMAVVERKFLRAGGLKRHPLALSRPLSQIARGIDEWLAEVDACNLAAICRSYKARRSANSLSDIQNRHVGGSPSQLGKLNGRYEPAGVKLVQGGQLLGREPLFIRPEGPQRRLQTLDQAGRAIVVAHTIKNIGHSVPLSCRVLVAEIRPLPADDYPG
jgi:hypothetical protein